MKRKSVSRDFRGQLILLGTGTSVGVPTIGCGCEVCTSTHPRNQRTRCSAILGLPEGNLLIDASPDLRAQLLREQIGCVDAVLFTHEHADHIFGFDDLRIFQFYLGHPVPLYCTQEVEKRLRHSFDYAFADITPTHVGATPQVDFHEIDTRPFQVLGESVTPIQLKHGPRFDVLGFRFGDVAYCTDTNQIPPESKALLQNLDVLILDALRHRPHATHFSLEEAVAAAEELGARTTYFTHISHELDYEETNRALPQGMALAHDGQVVML